MISFILLSLSSRSLIWSTEKILRKTLESSWTVINSDFERFFDMIIHKSEGTDTDFLVV